MGRTPAAARRPVSRAAGGLALVWALLVAAVACTTETRYIPIEPDVCADCERGDAVSGLVDVAPGPKDTGERDQSEPLDVPTALDVTDVPLTDVPESEDVPSADTAPDVPDVPADPDVPEDVPEPPDAGPDVVDVFVPPDIPADVPPVDTGRDTGPVLRPLSISLQFSDPTLSGLVVVAPVVTGGERIIGVEFYVDSFRLDTDLIPPYDFVLNTTQWADGPHVISVSTADSAGQVAEASANVVFDNTPPVFASTTPAEGQGVFFEDGPLRMRATSDDPDDLRLVEFRANGLLVGSFTSPPFEAEIPFSSLFITENSLPASVYLQFYAEDELGQFTRVTYTVTVYKRLLWTVETLGEIRAEPTLLPNGNIAVGNAIADSGGSSLPSKMFAFTPDGQPVWTTDVPAAINWAAVYYQPTDRLYVGGDDGTLYTVNGGGGLGPSRDLQQVLGGKVRVVGDRVYGVSYNGVVWVLNASNLEVVWTHPLSGNVLAAPAVGADGTVYVSCFDRHLYAVGPGGVIWSKETGGEVRSGAAIGPDGTIYFGSNDGYVYAVAPDGSDRWDTEVTGLLQAELLVGDEGGVYVGSSSKFLTRLDAETGDEVWSTRVGGISLSAPRQGVDGTIYGGTTGGEVYAVAPDDGELLWLVKVSPSSREIRGTVLVTDDRLYVGSVDRNFYALQLVAPDEE